MVTASKLRIGTRRSPMALVQAHLVKDRLAAAHPDLADSLEIVPLGTTGDREQHRELAEIGGKGLFTKEIEEALLARRIDLAVHSLKDMESFLPEGLDIACILPRDDPRDAFVSYKAASLAALPSGAVVGTSSPRRQAQVLRRRPDLKVVPFRGNVGTRLRKLAAGEVDATLLAVAGLARLGETGAMREILPIEIMLPAIGQGALAIECRAADEELRKRLGALDDPPSAAAAAAERAVLAALGGSCRTPIAGFAQIDGDGLVLEGALWKPDGSAELRDRKSGPVVEAAAIGSALGAEIKSRAGAEFGLE